LDAQGSIQGIAASALYHGNNQFSVFVPVDTDAGQNDKVLLNWFQITYPRLYKAHQDLIKFAPPAAASDTLVDYQIDNFTTSNVDIYKIGQSKIINAEVIPYYEGDDTFYEIRFQDRPFGSPNYVALTPQGKLSPDSVELDQGSDVLSTLSSGSPIELLVVAHRSFEGHSDLDAYISRRNANLGRTELVFVDDLFDELNYGIYDPVVIKDVMLALPTPPQYLLLVGDGSYDTRDAYGYGGNLIPVHFIQTFAYGAVACDFWYGLLDDDYLPDVSVGRISARDEEQLSDYLQKLEEYETQTDPGSWRNKHLYVSGSPDNAGLSFQAQSEAVIDRVDEDIYVDRLATYPLTSPFYGTTSDLIDLFDDGALAIDYNGHGAGAIWSDNSLFRLENLPQLSNQGKYPFVTNFTCFIGAFDTPQAGTILGEEFILEPEKGAIAVLASTGLGWFHNGGWLQEELNDLLYDNTDLKLGDIINAGKIAYFSYYGQGGSVESFDTIHLMNLIGDPSLQLAFAERKPEAALATPEFTAFAENVTISLPGAYASYQGVARVYDEYDYPALEFGLPFEAILIPSEDGLEATFPLPNFGDSLSHASGNYRLCLWNPSNSETYTASAPLYLLSAYSDSTAFDSLASLPSPVDIWDTFGFEAKLLDAQGIESAWAHFRIETNEGVPIVEHDSLEMMPTAQPHWYASEVSIDTTVYPYAAGDRVIYTVEVFDTEGDHTVSGETIFYILLRQPDPDWVNETLRMDVRNGSAALVVDVINKNPLEPWVTGVGIDSIDVLFTQQIEGAPTVVLGSIVLYAIPIDSTVEAFIPVNFAQPNLYDLEVYLNSEGWVEDVNPNEPYTATLRADLFNLSPGMGTGDTLRLAALLDTVSIYDPAGGSTAIDSAMMIVQAFVPPNGLSGTGGVLRFGIAEKLTQTPNQAELTFAYHNANDEPLPGYGIEIDFAGDVSVLTDSLWMGFEFTRYDSSIVIQDVKIHRQAAGQSNWQTIPGELTTLSFPPNPSYRIFAADQRAGFYSLMQNGDHNGPTLEFSVEGQIYTSGGYVPNQPKISILAQDFGGINQNPDSYSVKLDDEELLPNTHVEANGQVMTLSINPTLASGNYTVVVDAEDMFGNSSADSIQFQVTGEFHLDFIGNYPNPMKDKTYFAYRLTEQTTSPVEIKIYTVSGRLIRTLYSDDAEEINYGEIYWDGTDQDGDMIANGVYFYKFTAQRGDEKIDRTMTLAKLR
ncbi:T9SS type A sorting domain-containing protein, partial [bacterium]|nr:T9SS type A sorting domain-containing protein [bacterium]